MSAIGTHIYPSFVGNVVPHRMSDGTIENMDGSKMYVATFIRLGIKTKEESMPIDKDGPLTLRWAIGLCCVTFAAVALTGGGIYMAIRSDVSDLKAEVSTTRTESVSRVDVLRSDMTKGIETVYSKIDSSSKALELKIEKASDKTELQLDKINESIKSLRTESSR